MKKVILIVALLAVGFGSASAQNALQVYSPDAVYDAGTQTWNITSSSFELWVIASFEKSNGDRNDLYDITLVSALSNGALPASGSLDIFASDKTTLLSQSSPVYGTPPPGESPAIGSHGIFPTWYSQVDVLQELEGVSNTVGMAANDAIFDYQDPITATNSKGRIFKFWVETTYEVVHFDAYGFLDPIHSVKDRRVAPFSHDAEYMVPEPTTIVLMGLGLFGAGIVSRFRF